MCSSYGRFASWHGVSILWHRVVSSLSYLYLHRMFSSVIVICICLLCMFSFILVIVYFSFVYVCCSGKEERHFADCQRVIINQSINQSTWAPGLDAVLNMWSDVLALYTWAQSGDSHANLSHSLS